MNTDLMFSSKTNEWATPQDFYDKLNEEFKFTLDPCATINNHKCATFFTIKENGLLLPWAGQRVFVNPPYGKELKFWVEKSWEERIFAELIVMLIPARTDTSYFHKFIYNQAELRFIRGRLKFGDSKNSAPFPSMLVIYRNNLDTPLI